MKRVSSRLLRSSTRDPQGVLDMNCKVPKRQAAQWLREASAVLDRQADVEGGQDER